jgi:hypothetical protein
LYQKRRELHNQVGACVETLFSDHLEEFYGLLAYHYARAENWEKAQDYLFTLFLIKQRPFLFGLNITHSNRGRFYSRCDDFSLQNGLNSTFPSK